MEVEKENIPASPPSPTLNTVSQLFQKETTSTKSQPASPSSACISSSVCSNLFPQDINDNFRLSTQAYLISEGIYNHLKRLQASACYGGIPQGEAYNWFIPNILQEFPVLTIVQTWAHQ